MEDQAENPDLYEILKELATNLSSADKEDFAVMMFKVVAADGMEDAEEIRAVESAAELLDISSDSLQKARQRFFAER